MLTYETAVDGSDVIACHFSPSATPIYQSASSLKSMNLDCVKRIISHLSSMARRASLAVSAKLVSVTLFFVELHNMTVDVGEILTKTKEC